MIFRIAVNRNDGKGWRLWDESQQITAGYSSFAAATGNCADLRASNPNYGFRVIGIDLG
jgi:hypothetical protein